jgi:hypothetical protein
VGSKPQKYEVEERRRVRAAAPTGQRGYAATFTWVWPQYFELIGTRWTAGRGFTDQDRANSQFIAIVNQTLASSGPTETQWDNH